jgi:DNA-dependent protein kinase catalytic subunit
MTSDFGAFNGLGWDTEQALMNRIGGFLLIELYVATLPRNELLKENCPVASASTGKESSGNTLIAGVLKKSFYARSEIFVSTDQVAMELFRKYQCSAYKTLCAIVCNIKDDVKFYDTFLFKETPEKNEFIWQKMIDCSNEHIYDNITQEFEDFPKIKDKIVSIRNIRYVQKMK